MGFCACVCRVFIGIGIFESVDSGCPGWGPRIETMRHMSHSLNSLKAGDLGDYIGDYYRGY